MSFVRKLSDHLKKSGVEKGEKIAILSENRPEWVIADLGILSRGAVNVPLYPQMNIEETEYVLNHSEAVGILLSTKEQCQKILKIRSRLSYLRFIITFDEISNEKFLWDILSKTDLPDDNAQKFLNEVASSVKRSDEASIIYTSGTTGAPKGVVLTHHNFLVNVASCQAALPIDETDRFLSFLPTSHVFERTAGYYFALSRGAQIYYAENFASVPQNLKEVKPTIVCSVPRLYEKIYAGFNDKLLEMTSLRRSLISFALDMSRKKYLLERKKRKVPPVINSLNHLFEFLVYKKIRKILGGKLRFFISGGAPLPKEIGEFFYSIGVLIIEGYGLTETAPVLAVNRLNKFKFGTVGCSVEGVDLKIAEDGEIWARGENLMKGYFKNPEATSEIRSGEWLLTGDIGFFDGEGFLRIVDRKKDIIVTAGGKNISPQNIERLIVGDKFVSQVVVIGDKKPYLTALIVPSLEELKHYAGFKKLSFGTKEELIQLEEIRLLIVRRIAPRIEDIPKYEQIQYIKLLLNEFSLEAGELTPTLKIRRRVVMKKYDKVIAQLYSENSDRIAMRVKE